LKLRQGEKGVWQRGFEQHRVRNAADFEARHRFLLEAPVRAGLCARPQDWRWSSIHRPAQTGRYLPRWQGAEMVS
jgi:putative transposase